MFNLDFNLFDPVKPSEIIQRRKITLPFSFVHDVISRRFPELLAEHNEDGVLAQVLPDGEGPGIWVMREKGRDRVLRSQYIYGPAFIDALTYEAFAAGYLHAGERFSLDPYHADPRYAWTAALETEGNDTEKSSVPPANNDFANNDAETQNQDDEIVDIWPDDESCGFIIERHSYPKPSELEELERQVAEVKAEIDVVEKKFGLDREHPDKNTFNWLGVDESEWFQLQMKLLLLKGEITRKKHALDEACRNSFANFINEAANSPATDIHMDPSEGVPAEESEDAHGKEMGRSAPQYSPEEIAAIKSTTAFKVSLAKDKDEPAEQISDVVMPEATDPTQAADKEPSDKAERIRCEIEALEHSIAILKENPDETTWNWQAINDLEWELFKAHCLLLLLGDSNDVDGIVKAYDQAKAEDANALRCEIDHLSKEIDALKQDPEHYDELRILELEGRRYEADSALEALENLNISDDRFEQQPFDGGSDSANFDLTPAELAFIMGDTSTNEADAASSEPAEELQFYIELDIVQDSLVACARDSILGFFHKMKEAVLSL